MLLAVESECAKLGLHFTTTTRKTKVMAFNTRDTCVIKRDELELEVVDDFKYLGSYVSSTEQGLKVRIALAWSALYPMKQVWRSDHDDNLKKQLLVPTLESALFYRAEAWTFTAQQEKSLDWAFTRMLRTGVNISWKITSTTPMSMANYQALAQRRMALASHCVRHPEVPASPLILLEPTQGRRSTGS